MEESIHSNHRRHGSHREHSAHGKHRRHRSKFRIKWFDRFKRYDEFGFVNPEYDKINLVMGKLVAALILIALVVLLVSSFYEISVLTR